MKPTEYLDDNEVTEVSALLPPDFEGEGGCVEPPEEGFRQLIEYVDTGKPMCPTSLLGDKFLHLRRNLDRRPRIEYSEGHVYIKGSAADAKGLGGKGRWSW